MNILIVDDSKAMRMIVRRTLRQAGFGKHDTFQAGDGREALQVMSQNRIDLVLSDWNMPNMNGLQFLQFLRSRGSRVRFGFVTTEGTPDMRARAMAEGAQFVIVKPFTAQTFEDTLNTLFRGGNQRVEVQHNAPIAEGTDMRGILLPSPKAVATLFNGVLDRQVETVPWRSPPPLSNPLASGVYESDEKGQEAACMMDVSLAAYAAGAINLMHPSTITQELRKGALPQQLQDSIHEMFNLVARIFNAPSGRRIKLVGASVHPAPVLDEVMPFLQEDFAAATHMVLNIPGFGRGKLSVFVKKD